MMNGWTTNRFDAKAWEAIKTDIKKREFVTEHSDYFGCIRKGAICFDIVLRNVDNEEWILCADAYILGENTGYGYTVKGTPYDEADGIPLEFSIAKDFNSTLQSFIEQIDKAVRNDLIWFKASERTDLTWEMED